MGMRGPGRDRQDDRLGRGRGSPDPRALERSVWTWRVGASVYASVTRVGYFVLWVLPGEAIDLRLGSTSGVRMLVTSTVLAVVITPFGRAHARRQFEPVARWLRSGEPATPADQAAILDQPRRHALASVAYFVVGAVGASAVYVIGSGGQLSGAVLLVVGITMIGLHGAAFIYLGVERVLRPVAAAALVKFQPLRVTILSVRARFLLAFALGPGVTILGIAGFLSLRTAAGADLGAAIWPAVVLGLVDGYALVALTAASVTEPMRDVRQAMGAVFAGDFDVELGIDASSEVGLLQIGFNKMLVGLREQQRLRDLLDQYAGTEVAHRLVDGGGLDFVGTEVDASVLMVDLIGSTPFAETTPPTEVVASLNLFFETVVSVVAANGGWVNRFVGDAALCVFGAPEACEDHAARALSAARDLQSELAALRRVRPWLDAAVGVSSGTLVAAHVGSSSRHEFAVVGDAANEAARLTDEAKRRPGRVLASGSAIERAGAEAEAWSPAGTAILRGRSRSTDLFEPIAGVVAEVEDALRRERLSPS
jgi:adenylate cyclase